MAETVKIVKIEKTVLFHPWKIVSGKTNLPLN